MNRFVIFCLDDDSMVVEKLHRELAHFTACFDVITAESVEEAREHLDYLNNNNQRIGLLICDNELGTQRGIELLLEIDDHPSGQKAKTMLLSDLPQLDILMQAVNEGRLNYFLTKPWNRDELNRAIIKELTDYILENCDDNLLPYCQVLDSQRLLSAHIDRQLMRYRMGIIDLNPQIDDVQLADNIISLLHEYFNNQDETNACRTYSANHILTHEGQPNSFLWFIAEGEVSLKKKDEDGNTHTVDTLKAGSLIGSMSFVTGNLSFSTGVTLTKTRVIKLDKNLFNKVMQDRVEFLPLFTQFLFRQFNRRLRGSISTEIRLQKVLNSLELAYKQLIEKEKMAMLGQLVAGVAHELNNPVSAILRNSDILKETISHCTRSSTDETLHALALDTMKTAMDAKPMSTADARRLARELEEQIGDRQQARKLVSMGFTQSDELTWLPSSQTAREAQISTLEQYHQTGVSLRSVNVCAQRIAGLVRSLKGYARPDDESWRTTDILEGIEDTLVIFENRLKHHTLERHYNEVPEILCQPVALQQIWTNLIANALDAISTPGKIAIYVTTTALGASPAVQVVVEDNGSGIPDELKEKIFTLNYTTKKEGHFGLGIGLTVCQQIVHQHSGKIDVESEPGRFTKMRVILPVTPPVITERK
ncbi:ATP-binding protein [Parasalinivibrio latis]|uniref:ATP-binding protein n=1 Tax=Parasalinivibrio latis TaxID=2952610 RepID=UPI0030DDF583